MFEQAIVLEIMCQTGNDSSQVEFRSILFHLWDGMATLEDWSQVMDQAPTKEDDQYANEIEWKKR